MQQPKEHLQTLETEYLSRIERTQNHLTRQEQPLSQDFAEQAVELENEEVVERLDEEAKHGLALVRKALAKIESNEYGICESCGTSISQERLAALPQAETCIECADKES